MKSKFYSLVLLCVAMFGTSCNAHKLTSTSNTNVESEIFPNRQLIIYTVVIKVY